MNQALTHFKQEGRKTIEHLTAEFSRLQIGRASSALVEAIIVDSYGSKQDLKSVASISIPDSKTIQIQPWDKSMLAVIEKAIIIADFGINPVNNGIAIMLNMPPMTEERRKDLVKIVKKIAEEAKVTLRNHRQKTMDMIKKSDLPEDHQKGEEKKVQVEVDLFNKEIEEVTKKKETDIMTI